MENHLNVRDNVVIKEKAIDFVDEQIKPDLKSVLKSNSALENMRGPVSISKNNLAIKNLVKNELNESDELSKESYNTHGNLIDNVKMEADESEIKSESEQNEESSDSEEETYYSYLEQMVDEEIDEAISSDTDGKDTETNETPFKCIICGKSYKLKSSLKRHVLTHSGKNGNQTSGENGNQTSGENGNQISGGNENLTKQPLKCKICDQRFKSKDNLHQHEQAHLEEGSDLNRIFKCNTCHKKFKKKQHLQNHELSHSKSKNYSCFHCPKTYFQKYDLDKHLLSSHTIRKCDECGKTFENSFVLRKHQALHKKLEKASLPANKECHICHKMFQKARYLRCHLRMHAQVGNFVCEVCNKVFLYQTMLKEHSRSHTGVKPYSCEKCNKTFSTKSNQYRHLQSHFKIRMCPTCNDEFEDEDAFKAHRDSCRLQYMCGQCGFSTTKPGNLRRHVVTHIKYRVPEMDDAVKSEFIERNIFVKAV